MRLALLRCYFVILDFVTPFLLVFLLFGQVANRWCEQHNLPENIYQNQIVEFLVQNTDSAPATASAAEQGALDPLTGGQAYTPARSGEDRGEEDVNMFRYIPMKSFALFDTGQARKSLYSVQ